MSYYKPSFSQTVAMSRGSGRGFSTPRGSMNYRGSSGRGSSWTDRGSSRGGFSSNRGGRFSSSWNSSNSNNFDSRSRYNSSSGGGGDRYASNSRRPDDSNYKRSYRSEAQNSYSNRDASTHRSPERKRMRNEAPSSRRSHDGGYGDGYSASASRYETSQSYSDRRSFADDRRPSFRSRDDYRKPIMSSSATSVRQSPRGGYRGRAGGGSRGIRGSRSLREGIIRRRIVDTGYLRKRGAPLRSTSEYLRRLKLNRQRSHATRIAALKRRAEKSKSSEKEESDKEEENWENDDKEDDKKKEEIEKDDDKKSPKPSPKKDKEKSKDDSDKEDKKSGDEGERPRSRYTGMPFIKLTCTHCHKKCVTFNEYSIHLSTSQHISAMRRIAIKQKGTLARMRLTQRNAQREIEKNDESLAPRTNFCPLCKLNYRQLKAKHRMSDAHRNMKKFLMPYCRICRLTFKSPMLYENHMCSLQHIKRKARNDIISDDKYASDKEPPSPAEEDLENFMTLDSVGDVDEEEEDGTKKEKSSVEEGVEGEDKKPKETINVGAEHVKKVEVHYCDLCRIYLSRYNSPEKEIKEHCRGRMHLQRYVRYKEVKDLRRQAERIHRKSQEAREAKEKENKDKVKEEKPDGEIEADATKVKDEKMEEDAGDDKLWADVDKDLGEILAEVNTEGGNKSSDEDEDSRPNGERYDRDPEFVVEFL